MLYCGVGRAGAGRAGRACWACRAREAGGRAWARGRGHRRGRWQERTGRAGGSSARARSAGGRASGRRRGKARARAGSGKAGPAGAQAAGLQARARQGAAGVGVGVAWALGARPVRWAHGLCAWAGRGCALGALGHFWPGLTQYFPESNFLDIVHELGS